MATAPDSPDLVQLSTHPRGFRKAIGKTASGTTAVFYFGKDLSTARVNAWQKMKQWDRRPETCNDWEALEKWQGEMKQQVGEAMRDMVETAYDKKNNRPDFKKLVPPISPDTSKEKVQEAVNDAVTLVAKIENNDLPKGVTGPTITEAVTAYLSAMNERVGLKMNIGLKSHTYEINEYRINRVCEFFDGKVTHLCQLTRNEVWACVLHWCSLPPQKLNPNTQPKNENGKVIKSKPKPISAETCLNFLNSLKSFLQWCSDNEAFNYSLPKKFSELWSAKPEPREQPSGAISSADLKTLFDKSINLNSHREEKGRKRILFLCLSLNCGFYQSEIASLEKSMITLDGKEPCIERIREKTRRKNRLLVRSRWNLWPETVTLLKEYLAPKNSEGAAGADLAVLSEDLKPLVGENRCDAINLSWRRLCKVAKIKKTFSNLRDTGAEAVERLGGADTAEQYLAHFAKRGVLNNYSKPQTERLTTALNAWRQELVQAGVFEILKLKLPKKKAA